eukprot:3054935-Rhodomonas_salina.5
MMMMTTTTTMTPLRRQQPETWPSRTQAQSSGWEPSEAQRERAACQPALHCAHLSVSARRQRESGLVCGSALASAATASTPHGIIIIMPAEAVPAQGRGSGERRRPEENVKEE